MSLNKNPIVGFAGIAGEPLSTAALALVGLAGLVCAPVAGQVVLVVELIHH